jgi:hypothetical protein
MALRARAGDAPKDLAAFAAASVTMVCA